MKKNSQTRKAQRNLADIHSKNVIKEAIGRGRRPSNLVRENCIKIYTTKPIEEEEKEVEE